MRSNDPRPEEEDPRVARPRSLDAWVLFALALALRLGYLLEIQGTPLAEVLLIDSAYYHERGVAVAAGDWRGAGVSFMAPLYEYALGALYSLTGPSVLAALVLQCLGGALATVLTYRVGCAMFGRATGLGAGAVWAVYGPAVFYDGTLLTASGVHLLDLGCLALLGPLVAGRAAPPRGRLVLAGLCLGLAALGRANVLLFGLLALPALALCTPRGEQELEPPWRRALRAWVPFALGLLLGVLPATLRNLAAGGELVLVSANGGMNLYTGNHAGASGVYDPPDFLTTSEPGSERDDFIAEAGRRLGREVGLTESSAFWRDAALEELGREPGRAAGLMATKLRLCLHDVEAQTNLSYYFAQDHSQLLRLLRLRFGLVLPLAILGLAVSLSRRLALPYAFVATHLATCVLFFVSSEYRLPAVPVLAIFAAHGALWLARAAREREVPRLVAGLAVVLGAALLAFTPTDLTRSLTRKRVDYVNFATLYQREGKLVRAEELLRASLAIDPDYAQARGKLGALLLELGRDDEAAPFLEGLAEESLAGRAFEAWSEERWPEAERLQRELLAGTPENPARAHYRLGVALAAQERHAEAAESFRASLALRARLARVRLALARSLIALGQGQQAARQLDLVLEQEPAHTEARELRESLP